MSNVNFRDLLSFNTDEVERPKPLPAGHYLGVIRSHEFAMSKNKGTPFVRFLIVPESPTDDVIDHNNDLASIDLSRRELRRDYYITPQSRYRLADMLDAVLGKTTGRTADERIPETTGARVIFGVTQRTSEDGQDTYNDVTSIVAA